MNVTQIHRHKFSDREIGLLRRVALGFGCKLEVHLTDEHEEYALAINEDGDVKAHIGLIGVRTVFIDSVDRGYHEANNLWDIIESVVVTTDKKEANA